MQLWLDYISHAIHQLNSLLLESGDNKICCDSLIRRAEEFFFTKIQIPIVNVHIFITFLLHKCNKSLNILGGEQSRRKKKTLLIKAY